MKKVAFKDLPLYDLGTQIQIVGMVMQGKGETYNVMFGDSDIQEVNFVLPDHKEWKDLLYQCDTLGALLYPNDPKSKIVVRKTQRQIEQDVSWNVFRRDGYKCRYCGEDKKAMTVDHIVLWEDMGASVEDNLNTSCRKCNKTRGNMLYPDWLKSEYYLKNVPQLNHWINENAWEKAQKVPLRPMQRNR